MNALNVLSYLVLGAGLGSVFFAILFWNVRILASPAPLLWPVFFYFVRFGLVIAGFWFSATQGTTPLLSALAGFLIARTIMQYKLRRTG